MQQSQCFTSVFFRKANTFLNSFGTILPPGVVRERENMLQLKVQNSVSLFSILKKMNDQNKGATNVMS